MKEGQLFCATTEHLGTVGVRWGIDSIGWHIESPLASVPNQRDLTQAVCDGVSAVCGLSFYEQPRKEDANIVLSVGRGSRSKFDGPGGTLAYAYFPMNSNFKGQVYAYFDMDEKWQTQIEYFIVWLHEIGHNLGLGHDTSHQNQVMNPTYNPRINSYQDNDVLRLRRLYGPPKQTGTTNPPTVPGDDNGRDAFLRSAVLSLAVNGKTLLAFDLLKLFGKDALAAHLLDLGAMDQSRRLEALRNLLA